LLETIAENSSWLANKRVREAAERAVARVNERVAEAQRRAEDRRSRVGARTQHAEKRKSSPPPAGRHAPTDHAAKKKRGDGATATGADPKGAAGPGGDDGDTEGRPPNRRSRAGAER
jgi:hypothetical protein